MKVLPSAAAAALIASAAGCCVCAPAADKYFDRLLPEHTLKGFVYAIETDQFDWAYECLATSSREGPDGIGRFKFEIAVTFLDDPALEVSVFRLIVGVHDHRVLEEDLDAGTALLLVQSRVEDDDGGAAHRDFHIAFVREEGEWRIDFRETVRRLVGR